tara:strand:+ start:2705 stop:5692 length:2988 start_codon:yes stop_codon:yes gene_type:complete
MAIIDKVIGSIVGKGKKVDDPDITKAVDGVVDDVVTTEQADALSNTGEEVIDAVEGEEVALPFKNRKDRIEDDLTEEGNLTESQINQQAILNQDASELVEFKGGEIDYKNFDAGEIKVVNEMYESFLKGDTDIYDGPLSQWYDSTDGVDEGNFSDLINNMTNDLVTKYEKGSLSNDELLALASSLDSIEVFNKIRDKKPGEILDVPIYLRGLIESDVLMKKQIILQDRIMTGQSKDFQSFYKILAQQMALDPSLKDSISNNARSMQISGKATKRNPNYLKDVSNIMKAFDKEIISDEIAFEFVSAIADLNKREAATFAKGLNKEMKSPTRLTNFRDMWLEVWINSRLSSPITHIVNVVGNTGFMAMRTIELFGAAALNKVPGLRSRDGVMFNEAFHYARGTGRGFMLGLRNAKTSAITGVPTGADGLSKLDMPVNRAIHSSNLPDYMTAGKHNILAMGFNAFGVLTRVPGRLLITEDELAKGIIYMQELERYSVRAGNKARFDIEDAIKNGQLKPSKTAGKEAFDRAYLNSMKNPTSETVDNIKNSMSEGTFQADMPDGILTSMNKVLNNPNIKFVIPFHKTVMNIFLEVGKRNPLMAAFMPSVRKAIRGDLGPVARQTALSKIALGTSLMTGFGSMAYGTAEENSNMIITGMAPTNKAEREAFYRKGFQPYSIAIYNPVTELYESRSYSRFDPISPLLAISADVAYLMGRSDVFSKDNNATENATDSAKLFMMALAAVFPYLTEQPFLQGIKKLGGVIQPSYGDPEQSLTRSLSALGGLLMEPTVGLLANPTGPFGGWLQRQSDPKLYDVNATGKQMEAARNLFGPDVPQPIKEFYKVFNRAMLDNPFFNPDLAPKLNLWGREIDRKETLPLSPFRISDEKYNAVDDAMLKYGFGLIMPPGEISGVTLSSDEYNDYIKFINQDDKLLEEMNKLVLSRRFEQADIYDKHEQMQSIYRAFKAAGKQRFLASAKGKKISALMLRLKQEEKDKMNNRN